MTHDTAPAANLLTPREAAAFLRISPRTLERYRITGGGPPYIKVGAGTRTRVLYDRDALTAWLKFRFTRTREYGR